MSLYIFAGALLIMTASLIGVVTYNAFLEKVITKKLPYLVSFSAGVFLFTSGFMVLESLHLSGSILLTLGLGVAGFVGARAMKYFMPEFHHHHDSACERHTDGRHVLTGDALHNIADGLILVPAFMVSPWLGLGTTLSILMHELLQELSEFIVLKSLGYSTTQALVYNIVVSSTIFIGVGIGLLISHTELLQSVLLAFSAGFFMSIVFYDLFPHSHTTKRSLFSKTFLIHLLLIIAGIGVVGGINSAFSHNHTHEVAEDQTTP